MGKKGKWFDVVKKVFRPESKDKKDEVKKSKKKLELEAPSQSDPCYVDSSAFPAPEAAASQSVPHPEDVKLVEVEEQKRNAYSEVATVENSVSVVKNEGEVEHLANPAQFYVKSGEEIAAIKIQTAFRGYLARRTLRAMRGRVRLKSLLDGNSVKRQATSTLHCMQTLARVQTQVHSRRIRMSEENQALQRQMLIKHGELENLKMGEVWDDSLQTKEQIEASLINKQEAALRRERAMAYAFTHQWKSSSRSVNPMYMNPSNPQWGWSWLEQWIAAKPCAGKKTVDRDTSDDNASVKNSSQSVGGREIIKSYTHLTSTGKPSPGIQKSSHNSSHKSPATPPVKAPWTTSKRNSVSPKIGSVVSEDDSRSIVSVRSERHRRHSIATISVRDDESLASSPSFPSYMAPTVSTRARSHNQSPPASDGLETPNKSVPSVKKKLSYPASPSITRRHSEPPKVILEPEKDVEAHS